jgi:hypothetical protein
MEGLDQSLSGIKNWRAPFEMTEVLFFLYRTQVIRRLRRQEMKIPQTYRSVLVATHTINSAPQEPKSAFRGLMQRLGLTLLACTLVVGVTGSASAGEAQDEAAVRGLGDTFAKAFVQKNAELRASLFAENGTFVTPVGDFLQGESQW